MRRAWLLELLADERGQALVEYALLIGALVVGLAVSTRALGSAFAQSFDRQARALLRAR